MSVQERAGRSATADFIKADFHIHTPASNCYSSASVPLEQLVDAAVTARLGAIAVTDHQSTQNIDAIRTLGARKGLVIFPGTELTTRWGHVLALFDPATPVSRLNEFLDGLGVSPDDRGNGSLQLKDDIEEVFRAIDECGGIAIAAHIERWPTGFLESKDTRGKKRSIHASPYLSALEITQPQNRPLWNKGQMEGYSKSMACIQGSDAHSPAEIGRRPIFLKLSSIDLDGLRQAFREHEDRIRFPDEIHL